MAQSFQELFAELPQEVKAHLERHGFENHQMVADCASPEYPKGDDGKVIEKPVDVVFVETIATKVEVLQRGTSAWAKILNFYRKCYALSEEPPKQLEATPLEAKDTQAEEYYELDPAYRRKRLELLNEGASMPGFPVNVCGVGA